MELSTLLWFVLTIFVATFVGSSAGFGVALVGMPIMISLFGIQTAAPLFAPIALMINLTLLLRFRGEAKFSDVWRLIASSLFTIPLGVLLLKFVPAWISLPLLGMSMIWYVLSRHFQWRSPQLQQPAWAYLFGGMGGLLSGAYNTSGPPVIVYANAKGWEARRFKGNLQAYFAFNTVMTVSTHWLSGNYSADMLPFIAIAPLAIALGMTSGLKFSQHIDQVRFQQLVLALLLILGLRLIWSGFS